MNSLFGNHPIILFVLVFLAVFAVAWQLLSKPAKKSEKKSANWLDSTESGRDAAPLPIATQAGSGPALVATSTSGEAPDPSGIVAEVCSLRSPAREDVEESYRGRRVRWTLSLSAISPTEGQGATHTVRMYPSGRSPFSCGVYFSANEAECAVLQAAGKNDSFLIEGTIHKVEDRDIDLTDVRMMPKAA
jgi:hypothetical protein